MLSFVSASLILTFSMPIKSERRCCRDHFGHGSSVIVIGHIDDFGFLVGYYYRLCTVVARQIYNITL